ncbi:GNAT family N-acetyltransferase [Microvirga solisilvae]|uniref:GNAT family N-acetyltransferase n=1 Tax=Microvirga solisilvae TaxID=2919498 RepID=UPI001FAFB750|nr:GNAT family N-acetyltransferase [Microvirga solisilvae]
MISDLRDVPHFAQVVAERIWRAFWKDEGHPLELLTGLVQESFESGPIPTAFVAHEGERFLGTVSVIANDEEKRPQYTPWVAALWVEPEARRNGIGAALVQKATEFSFGTGAPRIYLLSRERRRAYYEGLGWTMLEADILEPGLHVLIRDAGA